MSSFSRTAVLLLTCFLEAALSLEVAAPAWTDIFKGLRPLRLDREGREISDDYIEEYDEEGQPRIGFVTVIKKKPNLILLILKCKIS